jgi:membrane protein
MAKLHDLRPVIRSVGGWKFLKRIGTQMGEDNLFIWASALAYSWLFSIFPFLILLLSLVPYLPEDVKYRARRSIYEFITSVLGREAPTLNDNLYSVMHDRHNGWLGIGLVVTIWVASGGISMTMSALDRCYNVKTSRPYLKHRSVATVLTLFVAICSTVVIVLLPIGTAVGEWLQYRGFLNLPLGILYHLVRYALAMFFSILVLTLIYYFGPNIRQRFVVFSPGAVFCALVWIVLDLLFKIYIDRYARYDKTYGTVGGAAILLLFFYLDSVVLLIGAEINAEIDFERMGVSPGSRDFTGVAAQKPTKLPEMLKEL